MSLWSPRVSMRVFLLALTIAAVLPLLRFALYLIQLSRTQQEAVERGLTE